MMALNTEILILVFALTVMSLVPNALIKKTLTVRDANQERIWRQAFVLQNARKQPGKIIITPMILNVPYVMLPACGVALSLHNVQNVQLVLNLLCIWIAKL